MTIEIKTIEQLCKFVEENNLTLNDINTLLNKAGINSLIVNEASSKEYSELIFNFHSKYKNCSEMPIFIDIYIE